MHATAVERALIARLKRTPDGGAWGTVTVRTRDGRTYRFAAVAAPAEAGGLSYRVRFDPLAGRRELGLDAASEPALPVDAQARAQIETAARDVFQQELLLMGVDADDTQQRGLTTIERALTQ